MDDLQDLDTAYKENPWIKHYRAIEISESLENRVLKGWIDRVWIKDFQEIGIEVKYMAWKRMLPEEWLREAE